MKYDSPVGRSASSMDRPQDPAPTACPVCRSSSIMTTAKSPGADSYWRCEKCGEVWNDARRKTLRRDAYAWR